MKKKSKVSKQKKQTDNPGPISPQWDRLPTYADYPRDEDEISCLCYGGDETTGYSVGGAPCPVHVKEAIKTARQREREVCAKIAQECGYLVLAELLRKDTTNETLKNKEIK